MPIIGMTVTKEVSFRNSIQPFSNMYFYNNGIGTVPNEADALTLLDEVVAFEKTIHAADVEFTYGRVWHQTLLALTTEMIGQKPLSGVGSATANTNMDRERAYLIRWRAGSDSRGNPVYLRKWYHTCGNFGTAFTAVLAGHLQNTDGLTIAQRNAIATKCQEVYNIGGTPGPWDLCAKSGRGASLGNTPQAHQYLEHHQLGDQWRGA
jgi:hypothetical protein